MCADQLKVSGTNLLNVYKLIFRVSHDNKNDNLFLSDNVLGKVHSIPCNLQQLFIKSFPLMSSKC